MSNAVISQFTHSIEWGGAMTTWGLSPYTWGSATSTHFVLDISEDMAASDSAAKDIVHKTAESVLASDVLDRTVEFSRDYSVQATVGDGIIKQVSLPLGELCELSEGYARKVELNRGENVGISEAETDPSDYNRNYYESVSIVDAIAKQFTKPAATTISVLDAFIKPFLPGVTSDIAISSTDRTGMTTEEFSKCNYPGGMSPWRPFVDGEYEYQDAIIRLSVWDRTPGGQTETRVEQEILTCDVEDVIDAGTANVTDVQRVEFNRTFTSPPIVTPTIRTCSDFAIPAIVSTDETGFEIRLRKADDTNATGSINWQAKGY